MNLIYLKEIRNRYVYPKRTINPGKEGVMSNKDLETAHYEYQTDVGPMDWVIYCTMIRDFDVNRTGEFQGVECPDCLKKMVENGYAPGKMFS